MPDPLAVDVRLRRIGLRAATEVDDGDTVGLGTGATADAMLDALGERVADGLEIRGVATSSRTRARAIERGIPLVELGDVDRIDVCIDGADEIDPALNLVKGRGGALLFEKLVALRAERLVIIASGEKLVSMLGTRLPLPVEVIPLGWTHTAREIASHDLEPSLRLAPEGKPFVTDSGNFIVDCASTGIFNPPGLASALKAITGVVEHGLFIGMTRLALTIDEYGAISEHAVPGTSS